MLKQMAAWRRDPMANGETEAAEAAVNDLGIQPSSEWERASVTCMEKLCTDSEYWQRQRRRADVFFLI
jgi:hypothetical protein